MTTNNPFDLLLDDDTGDQAALIAAYQLKAAAAAAATAAVVPAPPTQAVREPRNEGGRGGRGNSRGGRGGGFNQNRENAVSNGNGFTPDVAEHKSYERRSGFDDSRDRGGRHGGFRNGDADGERPKRNYERRSGTGRGNEIKRDGAGRGNWGTTTDDIAPEVEEPVAENEANATNEDATDEKPAEVEENGVAEKENTVTKTEEDPEEKQLTLAEYEKLREEKRKAMLSLNEERKGVERKVNIEDFESMHLVSKKKNDDEVFIKLGSEKEKKREAAEREEKTKKSVSISEFLKPAEGEGYYRSGGRGRGRARGSGDREGRYGGRGGGYARNNVPALKIEDQAQFPTLIGGH